MLDILAPKSLFNCLNKDTYTSKLFRIFDSFSVLGFNWLKIKDQPLSQNLISRKTLAVRWQCSPETIKRRTREGLLHPIRFNQRMLRYKMSEVMEIEDATTQAKV
jgi:hypothetical protein